MLVRILTARAAKIFGVNIGSIVTAGDRHARDMYNSGDVDLVDAVPAVPDDDAARPTPSPQVPKSVSHPDAPAPATYFGKPSPHRDPGLRVAWVQDAERRGGAELSNETIIGAGRRLGHRITLVTPQSFNPGVLAGSDVLIVNNIQRFDDDQIRILWWVLYERGKPYVRYEHDHREVTGDTVRRLGTDPFLGFARRLFSRSALNVMISQLQFDEHAKLLGDDFRNHPTHILHTGVDPDVFTAPEFDGDRDMSAVVCPTGNLIQRKGLMNVAAFAQANPGMRILVYSKPWSQMEDILRGLPNVEFNLPIPNEELVNVLRKSGWVIHLPEHYEDSGRVPVEGALCGCKVISNRHTGVMGCGWWEEFGTIRWTSDTCRAEVSDRLGLAEAIRCNQMGFWREVERRLDVR